MSRAPMDYSAPRAAPPVEAFDPDREADAPVAGFYKTKLSKGGHPVGVRIWFGPPLDPVTGEEMDRSHRWQAHANGRAIDLDRVWPFCGRHQIDEREYRYLAELQTWAERNAPDSPQANPHRRINPLTAPLPF